MIEYVLKVATRSDRGRVRQFNEDSLASEPARGLVAIADGMAIGKGAEIASRIATAALVDGLASGRNLAPRAAAHAAFAAANRAIRARAEAEPMLEGMGTTLAAAWFRNERVCLAHVGDSRIYRYRAGRIERMTMDHSFVQAQLAAGALTVEESRESRSRHLVTRLLGAQEQVVPDLGEHEVLPGDLYVLCTDGLHDLVDDADIAATLEVLSPNLELIATTLITLANDRGGPDNVSVVVVRTVDPTDEEEPVEPQGLFGWLRAKIGT
jgi:serine/threonine protein phosphatase PrpC